MAPGSTAPPPTSALQWSAVLDAVAHQQVRVVLTSPSGARVVLVAQEELTALEQRAKRTRAAVLLTARERQALLLIEQGHSTAQVAAHLGVAVGTAAQHLAAARRKYGARTSVQAAALARQADALG